MTLWHFTQVPTKGFFCLSLSQPQNESTVTASMTITLTIDFFFIILWGLLFFYFFALPPTLVRSPLHIKLSKQRCKYMFFAYLFTTFLPYSFPTPSVTRSMYTPAGTPRTSTVAVWLFADAMNRVRTNRWAMPVKSPLYFSTFTSSPSFRRARPVVATMSPSCTSPLSSS